MGCVGGFYCVTMDCLLLIISVLEIFWTFPTRKLCISNMYFFIYRPLYLVSYWHFCGVIGTFVFDVYELYSVASYSGLHVV